MQHNPSPQREPLTLYSASRTIGSYEPTDPVLLRFLGLGDLSSAGINISETAAQNISTVYACVTMISQTLAALPICCFKKDKEDNRLEVDDHPAYWIWNKSPDDVMTAFMARETMQGHILLRGNAFFEIIRNFRGQAVEAHLLDPRRMSVEFEEENNGQYPTYYYSQPSSPREKFDRSQLYHFSNWTTNGLLGISPLTLFRESLGLTVAANKYTSEYFRKGGHPLGFLTRENPIGDKERKQWQGEWKELYGSLDQAHQVGILGGGLQWQNIGLTNNDAQLLGLRQFQKYICAELFRVPPFLLGDTEQPLANIENVLIQFLVFTLLPWMKRHEAEINMKSFTRVERLSYYAEYNADAILRGDAKSRAEAFQIQARNGVLLLNEWRRKENRPKIKDGDVPLIMASQIAKLDDVISGKVNLSTSSSSQSSTAPAAKSKRHSSTQEDPQRQINRIAKAYSKLDTNDRDRLKGIILSMNGSGTFPL